MSWNIDENYRIEMTKGDTPTFGFEIFLPDGSAYEYENGDRVVFAAKANKYDSEPAFIVEAAMESKTISFKCSVRSSPILSVFSMFILLIPILF